MELEYGTDPRGEMVSWNLSQNLIQQIGNSLQQATRAFIDGKIASAFTIMQSISLAIHQDLAPDELKLIEKMEADTADLVNYGSTLKGFTNDANMKERYNRGRIKYIKYHHQIMKSLKRHGYSIPPKADHTKIV